MEFPPLFFFGTNLASFCIVDSLNNLRFDRDPALDNTIRSMHIREIYLLNESGQMQVDLLSERVRQSWYFIQKSLTEEFLYEFNDSNDPNVWNIFHNNFLCSSFDSINRRNYIVTPIKNGRYLLHYACWTNAPIDFITELIKKNSISCYKSRWLFTLTLYLWMFFKTKTWSNYWSTCILVLQNTTAVGAIYILYLHLQRSINVVRCIKSRLCSIIHYIEHVPNNHLT